MPILLCCLLHRKYFGDSKEPYSIAMLGTKLYILTDPRDISEAYRNSSTLSFEIFVKLLLRTCGSSKFVVEKMYQESGSPSRGKRPLGRALHDLNVQQSFPGPRFEGLSMIFQEHFEKILVADIMPRSYRHNVYIPDSKDTLCVSLSKWCADVVINASQKAYFGDSLSRINPDLAQTFVEFDTRSWQLLYGFPKLFSNKMHSAKEQTIKALTLYFESPQESKADAAWVTQLLEKEMRQLGFKNEDMATLMMLQYWGINTNVHKACFWMLAYLLYEPELADVIREETALAFIDGSLDVPTLEKSCPHLQGLWLEVLRLTVSSSSVRYVTEDTFIGGRWLQSGNILVNSCRQLHFDESVFGQDAHKLDPSRFVRNPKLQRSTSWKPYGGGVSLCPGQFVARRVTCLFVTLVLRRFDIGLPFPQSFPQAKDKSPDLGIFVPETDLFLNLKKRPEC